MVSNSRYQLSQQTTGSISFYSVKNIISRLDYRKRLVLATVPHQKTDARPWFSW